MIDAGTAAKVQTSTDALRWQFWELLWTATCQHRSTSDVLLLTVRRCCRPVLRVLRHHGVNDTSLYRRSSGQLWCQGWRMYASPAWRGFITSALPIFNELRRLNVYVSADIIVQLICQTLKCLWTSLMNGFFVPSSTTHIILCTRSFHLNLNCRKNYQLTQRDACTWH